MDGNEKVHAIASIAWGSACADRWIGTIDSRSLPINEGRGARESATQARADRELALAIGCPVPSRDRVLAAVGQVRIARQLDPRNESDNRARARARDSRGASGVPADWRSLGGAVGCAVRSVVRRFGWGPLHHGLAPSTIEEIAAAALSEVSATYSGQPWGYVTRESRRSGRDSVRETLDRAQLAWSAIDAGTGSDVDRVAIRRAAWLRSYLVSVRMLGGSQLESRHVDVDDPIIQRAIDDGTAYRVGIDRDRASSGRIERIAIARRIWRALPRGRGLGRIAHRQRWRWATLVCWGLSHSDASARAGYASARAAADSVSRVWDDLRLACVPSRVSSETRDVISMCQREIGSARVILSAVTPEGDIPPACPVVVVRRRVSGVGCPGWTPGRVERPVRGLLTESVDGGQVVPSIVVVGSDGVPIRHPGPDLGRAASVARLSADRAWVAIDRVRVGIEPLPSMLRSAESLRETPDLGVSAVAQLADRLNQSALAADRWGRLLKSIVRARVTVIPPIAAVESDHPDDVIASGWIYDREWVKTGVELIVHDYEVIRSEYERAECGRRAAAARRESAVRGWVSAVRAVRRHKRQIGEWSRVERAARRAERAAVSGVRPFASAGVVSVPSLDRVYVPIEPIAIQIRRSALDRRMSAGLRLWVVTLTDRSRRSRDDRSWSIATSGFRSGVARQSERLPVIRESVSV